MKTLSTIIVAATLSASTLLPIGNGQQATILSELAPTIVEYVQERYAPNHDYSVRLDLRQQSWEPPSSQRAELVRGLAKKSGVAAININEVLKCKNPPEPIVACDYVGGPSVTVRFEGINKKNDTITVTFTLIAQLERDGELWTETKEALFNKNGEGEWSLQEITTTFVS